MSMRIFSALAAIAALAACAPESGAPKGESVECAMEPGASFSAQCVLEDSGAGALTIHHPDATFQRVQYDAASGALTSADGAQILLSDPDPAAGTLEFAIGSYRYRIDRQLLASPTS